MSKNDLPINVKFAKFLSYITFNQFKPTLLYKYKCILSYMIKDQFDVIQKWNIDYSIPEDAKIPKIIWVMWWTGDYHNNQIVSVCISRIKEFANEYGYQFNLINENNLSEYINLSDIVELYKEGYLSVQGLSDSIRFKLLREYGGFWMDATIFLTSEAPKFLNQIQRERKYFSVNLENYPRWKNVSGGTITSYFWATYPNNAYFGFLDDFYNGFLRKHKFSIDYFMNDYSFRIAHDELDFARKMVDELPPSNPDIYFLNRNLFEQYDELLFTNILSNTVIFKMNWRKRNNKKCLDGTYWSVVFKEKI